MLCFQILLLLDHTSRGECHDSDYFRILGWVGGFKGVLEGACTRWPSKLLPGPIRKAGWTLSERASHVRAGLAKVGQLVVAIMSDCNWLLSYLILLTLLIIQLLSYLIARLLLGVHHLSSIPGNLGPFHAVLELIVVPVICNVFQRMLVYIPNAYLK